MSSFDNDPVKDFFDNEREQIDPQHGNDLHWQSIVRQARIQRRSRFLGYAVGMTAGALVIGGVTYGAFMHNDPALVPAARNSAAHSLATKTPPSRVATSAPKRVTAPIPPTSVRTKPAAPTAETKIVVLRPVTRSGRPAAGYTVTNEKANTIMCGGEPSRVAVDDSILTCSPSYAYAVACWKAPSPSMAICFRDPWSKKLVRMPAKGSFPTVTAPRQAQPLGLLLSDGERCMIRIGGSWNRLAQHPNWGGTYSCTNGKALWSPGNSYGINRSSPSWTVNEAPMSGSGPLSTRRVVKAYFIGTQGG